MKHKWHLFQVGDLVEWLPELIEEREKYNKSKNKRKASMVQEFRVARVHDPEVLWPLGVMEIIGKNPEYGIELIPYNPEKGKRSDSPYRGADTWEIYKVFVRANEHDIMLSPTIYGEEVYIQQDLDKLGF
jgi:hypothetical protein